MNAPVLPEARMKVDEFLAWSERQPDYRYELVDGKIVAMARDTVRHNRTKFAAWRTLDYEVRMAGLPCLVLIDGVGVAINDKTLRMPDVFVQCGAEPDPDALIIESPLIVVEVVSPSSERDDINAKIIDYFSVASIRHYPIVFSEKRVVIRHQRNEDEIATRIAHDGDIALNPSGVTVAVAALLGPVGGAEVRP